MRWNVLVACLIVLFAGCLGSTPGDDATDANDSTGQNDMAGAVQNAENSSRYTSSGLPRVRGVGDGASFDLRGRVLWLNRTPAPFEDDVVVNLTKDPEDRNYQRSAAYMVMIAIRRTVETDRRLEPLEGEDEAGYRTMRRYLADALLRNASGETQRQPVVVRLGDGHYRVEVGDVWRGGPVIDPSDPPHELRAPLLGRNVSVVVRHEGTTIMKTTRALVSRDAAVLTNVTEPGNYSVTLTAANGTTYTASFTVSLSSIGDCNASSTTLKRTDGTELRAVESSLLRGCPDSAD